MPFEPAQTGLRTGLRNTPRVAVLLLLLPLAAPVNAADADGNFAIKGGGLQTCEKFAAAFDEGTRDLALYGGWIDGYLTALNQTVDGVFDHAPWQTTQTMLGLTKLACDQAGPDASVMMAFHRVRQVLTSLALTAGSPVEGVRRGDVSVVLYREIALRIEQSLSERGYTVGPVDGTLDTTALDALLAFQRDEALDQTGMPDQPTLVRLLMN